MAVMAALHLQMKSEPDILSLPWAHTVKANQGELDEGLKDNGILSLSTSYAMHYLHIIEKF